MLYWPLAVPDEMLRIPVGSVPVKIMLFYRIMANSMPGKTTGGAWRPGPGKATSVRGKDRAWPPRAQVVLVLEQQGAAQKFSRPRE